MCPAYEATRVKAERPRAFPSVLFLMEPNCAPGGGAKRFFATEGPLPNARPHGLASDESLGLLKLVMDRPIAGRGDAMRISSSSWMISLLTSLSAGLDGATKDRGRGRGAAERPDELVASP